MDKQEQQAENDEASHSAEEDIMLRARTRHTFGVEEIVNAKVSLYGAASPVHTEPQLRLMFQDARVDTRLEEQRRQDIKLEEDYGEIYLKQHRSGRLGRRID